MRAKLPYLDRSASRWSDFFGSSTTHTNRISEFCYFKCEFMESDFLVNKLWHIHMEYLPCHYISGRLLDFN